MPLVKISISNTEQLDKQKIMKEISIIAGEETGKGEEKLMVCISESSFFMRGSPADCAFVDIRGIGKIEKSINAAISRRISAVLISNTGIPAENIYLNFTDMPRDNWGHAEGVY